MRSAAADLIYHAADGVEVRVRAGTVDGCVSVRLGVATDPVRLTVYFDSPEQVTRVMRVLTRARRELIAARAVAEDDRPKVAA